MRIPLFVRLLVASLLPALLLFGGFAYVGHYLAARSLERELGERLTTVANLLAAQLDPQSLALLQPGDEETRTYRNLHRRLEATRASGDLARVYLVDASLNTLVDTQPDRPIGSHDFRLDAAGREIKQALSGLPTSSVLFRGLDGIYYKSGFARVGGAPGRFVVGVDGAATLYEELWELRSALQLAGGLTVLVVLLVSLVLARRITTRLAALGQAAERIGQGDLTTPVAGGGPDEIGVVAATLEAMRRQVGERDERMQMMLAGIAHEVRNPLAGMSLYAGLLREDLGEDERLAPQLDHVKKVERELGHLQEIVTSFLEYARRPRPELVPATLPTLAQLIDEVRDLEAHQAERLAVELRVEVPRPERADERLVAIDRIELRRALHNLVRNALQATAGRPAARVTLAIAVEERHVTATVADNGPGITPEQLDKIWTPFFTTKQQGTGLGLAFVKEIVADHHGTISVDSTVGTGTTFQIRLPRLPAGD